MAQITISTITPIYGGAAYLKDLVRELEEFRNYLIDHNIDIRLVESIFVVDECIDNSREVLYEAAQDRDWVNIIELSTNFGQHPATIAGILHSSGDWVATLDEDLQHRPKYIIRLLKTAIDNGADICYAAAEKNVHKSVVRDALASYFKKITARLLNNKSIPLFNSFRIVRGDIARAASAICRHETYLDIAFCWFTNRICCTKVSMTDLRNQNEGGSGYSLMGLVRHSKRMVMSSKIGLLRIGILVGLIAFTLSLALSAYALYSSVFHHETMLIRGWASTILIILFFSGLICLLLGFILESVSDLVITSNGKPTFFVVDRSKDVQLKEILKNLSDVDL